MFPTDLAAIRERLAAIEPDRYAATRNFTDGAVTRLSPYLSRGVLSTADVLDHLLARGYALRQVYKFVKELAWRDYFQRVWQARGADIDADLLHPQPLAERPGLPLALLEARTGVQALDAAVQQLYATGYMHNHVRMYTAAVACNVARCHWLLPARWLYYHLLDGDWAANALNWQWIAGSFSRKPYFANQGNVSHYTHTPQQGTFLDLPYGRLEAAPVPAVLGPVADPPLVTPLPAAAPPVLQPGLPTYIYTYYNLDPAWGTDAPANRVLLLEPAVFERYPVSEACLDFALALGRNLPGLQLAVMPFADLQRQANGPLHYREHPLNAHFQGTEHPRRWLHDGVAGFFPSFHAFWKQIEPALKARFAAGDGAGA